MLRLGLKWAETMAMEDPRLRVFSSMRLPSASAYIAARGFDLAVSSGCSETGPKIATTTINILSLNLNFY